MPEKVASWLDEYSRHGDPMQASAAVYGAERLGEAA